MMTTPTPTTSASSPLSERGWNARMLIGGGAARVGEVASALRRAGSGDGSNVAHRAAWDLGDATTSIFRGVATLLEGDIPSAVRDALSSVSTHAAHVSATSSHIAGGALSGRFDFPRYARDLAASRDDLLGDLRILDQHLPLSAR